MKKTCIFVMVLFMASTGFARNSDKTTWGWIITGVGLLLAGGANNMTNTEIKTPSKEWDFYGGYEVYNADTNVRQLQQYYTDPNPDSVSYNWSHSDVSYINNIVYYTYNYYNHHIEYNTKTISRRENEAQFIGGLCLASIGIGILLNEYFDNSIYGVKMESSIGRTELLAYYKY